MMNSNVWRKHAARPVRMDGRFPNSAAQKWPGRNPPKMSRSSDNAGRLIATDREVVMRS